MHRNALDYVEMREYVEIRGLFFAPGRNSGEFTLGKIRGLFLLRGETQANLLWGKYAQYALCCSVALGRNARILWESICCSGEKRVRKKRKMKCIEMR